MFRLAKLACLIVIISGCQRTSVDRSFYYWKTRFDLSNQERDYLSDLKIKKLHIRFFDIEYDEISKNPMPVGTIRFANKVPEGIDVVPVIYITNKTLQKTADGSMVGLTSNLHQLVKSIAAQNAIKFTELQIDCDWSETTREKYFRLLKLLKAELKDCNLSATIRLHQVKYDKITGVPPVDRGMLMFYNMGKVSAKENHNSIFDKDDAAKYVSYIKKYSLPLDIALPLFSWGIHIREHKPVELLNNLTSYDFSNNANFIHQDEQSYLATQSFFFRGFYFMKNDVVKIEEISPDLCQEAANMVANELSSSNRSIALFNLDSLTLSRYEKKNFEKIYSTFH